MKRLPALALSIGVCVMGFFSQQASALPVIDGDQAVFDFNESGPFINGDGATNQRIAYITEQSHVALAKMFIKIYGIYLGT